MTAGNSHSNAVYIIVAQYRQTIFLNVCKYIFRYKGATRINALLKNNNIFNDPFSLKKITFFAYLRLDMHWIPPPLL
jgi:hypothetical protein